MGPDSVTVVIPVKNGMPRFTSLCAALRSQDYGAAWNVICIDSGSTDGSQNIARSHGFCVHDIPPQSFGHGRTRNLGAQMSDAEYVAYLTQDAIPDNTHWLAELVKPLRDDPKVAGAFSRHIAHQDADPYVAREIQAHFESLADYPLVEITDRSAYDANPALQQTLHFYSNNASALRHAVWRDFPYPDVQFAEDQLWAKTVLEAGYRKAYSVNSIVRHSHAFGPIETLRRSFDESRAFYRLFGYKLSKTPLSVCASSAFLIKREMGLALRHGWLGSHPLKSLSRIGEAVARPLGHYLGCREGLPDWLQKRLSRDDWIRQFGE